MMFVQSKKLPAFKPKKAVIRRFKDVTLVHDEPQAPNANDTLSHAIALYATLRDLWRQGSMAENGVVYVKVRGEFVEIKVTRPRF